MPNTILRIPAEASRAVFGHPEFRYLGCAGRIRGDWVERRSDRALFYEVHDPSPADAKELMDFARRVASHLIPAEPPACP